MIDDVVNKLKKFRNNERNRIRSNYFNSIADPVAYILGAASKSHPVRSKQIILDLTDKGVEIIFRSDEALGYSPGLAKGKPGQIIIHENASSLYLLMSSRILILFFCNSKLLIF